MARPEDRDQLVLDDLENLLSRRERRQHFLPEGLLPDSLDKLLDDPEIDVRLQQRRTDLAQAILDVLLGQLPLPAQVLERALQFL